MPKLPQKPAYDEAKAKKVIADMDSMSKKEAVKAKLIRAGATALDAVQKFVGIRPGNSIFEQQAKQADEQTKIYEKLKKENGWN